MLQIKDICKEYNTGGFVQKALDHVSLSFRDSEFVAILGPSGSGKTTLLNVIGGLDRYDSGDLIINDVSTRRYNDRDWDAYRNHSVGFIFQSYNLIPHQTVLANVELALTIAGISREERTRRAKEALERVGLGQQLHKRPSQMSGGQMQRVAIARALVNEPDILLADEPTGALDSETSIQVMELLKEVAADRLVVMVTHNPELARQYATRVVEVKDGHTIADSDPFEPETKDNADYRHARLGKASMSFLTALGLSFNNLGTKLKRTLLVAFAGSIGIIGIALIMSVSNGMNRYIDTIQQETLSEYPIQVTSSTFDFSSFAMAPTETQQIPMDAEVKEMQVVEGLFSTVATNDLHSLKSYFDQGESGIEQYTQALEYSYGVSPVIYTQKKDTVRQVHPDQTFAAMGFGGNSFSSMFMGGGTDVFHAMPETEKLYTTQYEVKAGRWPSAYNECVLVLTENGFVSDLTLYAMGVKDGAELDEMVERFIAGESSVVPEKPGAYRYEDFVGITFRLVDPASLYSYDEEFKVWADKSGDKSFLRQVVEEGEELTLVGVVQPKANANSAMLNRGINYPADLVYHVIEKAGESEIVRSQLDDPDTDVITGKKFGEESEQEEFSLGSLFDIDAEAMQKAFQFDPSALSFDASSLQNLGQGMDFSNAIDPDQFAGIFPELTAEDIAGLFVRIQVDVSLENAQQVMRDVTESYLDYASDNASTDYARLPEALQAYFATDAAREIIVAGIREAINNSSPGAINGQRLQNLISRVMDGFVSYVRSAGLPNVQQLISDYLAGNLSIDRLQQMFNQYMSGYLASSGVAGILQGEVDAIIRDLVSSGGSNETARKVLQQLLEGYNAYAVENGLPEPAKLRDSFSQYMATEEARTLLTEGVGKIVNTDQLQEQLQAEMQNYTKDIGTRLGQVMQSMMGKIGSSIADALTGAMSSLAGSLGNIFNIDGSAFADAIKMNMDGEDLRALMTSLLNTDQGSYESNLTKLGYADLDAPTAITIYPRDFESKDGVLSILDTYNETMAEAGEDDKTISYNDMVGTMMDSVTEIINAISYVLVAFVSISLVVSSIMIGVITYISVLERKKEIGILRAIGASKRNVSSVFNAETFIIGALSGIIGIVISLLLLIPGNYLIHHFTDQPDPNAWLPVDAAAMLVLLSIILTMIGGLIPSRQAAKCDPVTALRTE